MILLPLGKREVQSLNVKCDNCRWTGAVGTIAEHLDTCEFALIPCSNQCKSDQGEINCFMRKDLDQHLGKDCPNREYTCEYCRKMGTFATIQVHDKTCKKKIIPCTNIGCRKNIQRQHLQKHINFECQFTIVTCKHKDIGCDRALKRKDVTAHEENDSCHLHMAIATVSQMKKIHTEENMFDI